MHHRSTPRGSHHSGPRGPLRSAGVLGALVAAVVLAPATPAAPAHAAAEGCPPDSVTVVVDSTELGGQIAVGCASAGGSGTDALVAAGFTETRDAGGYICAVDARPDPCPTEFTGSFWSYWHGADGQWQSYEVGSDDSTPEPGAVEGWRYGDGSSTPGTAPDEARPTTEAAAAGDTADDEASTGLSPAVIGGIGLIAVLVVAAVLAARRRSGIPRGDGPAGQD